MKIIYLSYENPNIPDHEVMTVNINTINSKGFDIVVDEVKQFNPDIIIEREFNDGKAVYYDLLKKFPKVKKVFWGIDTHVGRKRHEQYSKYFDYIFLAISSCASEFDKLINKPVKWLPLYFPGNPLPVKENQEIELSFVGNYKPHFFAKRREYLKLLKPYGIQIFEREYSRMPEIMNNSLISFNCSLSIDMNFRVFEALGYGSFLLTNNVPDLHKIDKLSSHVSIYNNQDELINAFYGLCSGSWINIRKRNQQWILENHCLKHRIDSLIEMTVTNKQLEF